jgi:Tfp pilus assembly protein PilN
MMKINLLPPEKRKKIKKVKPAKKKTVEAAAPKIKFEVKFDLYLAVPLTAAIIIVLLIVSSFFWLGHKEKNLKTSQQAMKVELNKLNQIIVRTDNLKEQTKKLRERMEVILNVDRNRYLWPRILDEVSAAMPNYTWLESIAEKTPFPQLTIRLEGVTMNNLLLSQLLSNLENRELLNGVKLISSSERLYGSLNTKYYVIECSCTLNQPVDSTTVAVKAKR